VTAVTIADALRAASAELEPVGGTGRLDATLLLEHATGATREAFLRDGARPLTAAEAEAFRAGVARRLRGIPVAYIVGSAGFYGRTFAVDERVLVPRPETEHVVEAAIADARGRGKAAGRIADIGTGSGAIAISLAAELPDAWVLGSDVSRDAIRIARRNAAKNNVFQSCTFVHGDLAAPLVRFAPLDTIVANLPYIPPGDIPRSPDPVSYEPVVALDGGDDGLDLYRRLIAQLPVVAAADATIFFEAAPGTIEPLAALVEAAFPGAHIEIGEDYAGLERFVQFTLAPG
jgi:release factor glutamine methyltransferase